MKIKVFKFLIYLLFLIFLASCQSKTAKTDFAEGTPEELSKSKVSYTGIHLRKVLKPKIKKESKASNVTNQ